MVFDMFVGSYIHLVIKGIKADTGGGKISNMRFAGYLLDEDDLHYFIGQEATSVYAAVKKDEVAAILLHDEVEDLMEQVEVPEGQEVQ